MKISKFADKFGISNDTVRYYMDLNLIISDKIGGHYNFDKKCEEQLKEILNLKEMEFTLQEIKMIFNYKRMGKLTSFQQNKYYQEIYQNKMEEIEVKISELKNAKSKLHKKINELKKSTKKDNHKLGIPLAFLEYLDCPKCRSSLSLDAVKVENNQVLDGMLKCKCGEKIEIDDGIINSNEIKKSNEMNEDLKDSLKVSDKNNLAVDKISHIDEYIKETDANFIDKSYQSLEWLKNNFLNIRAGKKIILEVGTGYGYFLRQIYLDLDSENYYICVDKNHLLNRYLKKILEWTGIDKNIIFITADLPNLPLKNNIVDLLIDFAGTSNYSFENKEFLPEELQSFLKKDANLLASYIIYKKFGKNNIVPLEFRLNFKEKNIKNRIIDLNFSIDKEFTSNVKKIEKSPGIYESFAQKGDEIYSYQVMAKRWG